MGGQPRNLSIRWLSDPDYRAMEKATGSEYTTTSGATWVISPDPAERKAILSLRQIGTPDGRWHGWASSRLASHTLHSLARLVNPRPGPERDGPDRLPSRPQEEADRERAGMSTTADKL